MFELKNAKNGGVPTYEHDDCLYLEKREQIKYNVQPRDQVDAKYELPSRAEMIDLQQNDSTYKYKSHILSRFSK